jgi:hypothetical protein
MLRSTVETVPKVQDDVGVNVDNAGQLLRERLSLQI